MHYGDNSGKRQCNICILGIIRVYRDNSRLWGYFEFIRIFRVVYHRIEITISHVTSNFPFSRTRIYTNVRKVEVYEYKLVLNCGQFYTLFSL